MTDAGIDPGIAPSGDGCVGCDAADGWWLHLRRCALCGHIGCCDTSPSQHARMHAETSGHPVIASFEPAEDWLWNFDANAYMDTVALAPPTHHPWNQPVPGPAGRVPADWEDHLH
jgi:hypothetical protein